MNKWQCTAYLTSHVYLQGIKSIAREKEVDASKSVSSLGDREGMRFDGAAVIKCCGLMRKPGGEALISRRTRMEIRCSILTIHR